MTKEQVIGLLQTNPLFALKFAVDNNPAGVVASLANHGILMPPNTVDFKAWALSELTKLIAKDKQKAILVVTSTPYNKGADAAEYTKNMLEYFMSKQPAQTVTTAQRFSLDALLSGLGAGLSTYSGVSLAGEAGAGTPLTAEQIAAAEKLRAEEEAAKKKKTYIIIASVIGGLILLSVIIYFVTKKKKEN